MIDVFDLLSKIEVIVHDETVEIKFEHNGERYGCCRRKSANGLSDPLADCAGASVSITMNLLMPELSALFAKAVGLYMPVLKSDEYSSEYTIAYEVYELINSMRFAIFFRSSFRIYQCRFEYHGEHLIMEICEPFLKSTKKTMSEILSWWFIKIPNDCGIKEIEREGKQ